MKILKESYFKNSLSCFFLKNKQIGFSFGAVYSMDLGKYIMTFIHHYPPVSYKVVFS
jgi:hypothetical protein